MKILRIMLNLTFMSAVTLSTISAQESADKKKAQEFDKKEKWSLVTWKRVGDLTKKKRSFVVEKVTTVAGVRGAEAEDNLLKQLYYKGGAAYPSRLELKNAVVILEHSVKMNPDDPSVPESLYFLGQCYIQLGENNKAIRNYEDLIEYYPESEYAAIAEKEIMEY